MTFNGHRAGSHRDQAVNRDISDRITVIATGSTKLGINGQFYVEQVKEVITAEGSHTVTWGLSDARTFSDSWVLDVSTLGTNTRLAY